MSHRITALTVALWTILAGAGGSVRFLVQSLEGKTSHTPTVFLVKMAASAIVSGFTGLMMALLISTMTENHVWQYIGAGISGYTGPKTMDLLFAYLRQKFLPAS